MCLQQLYAAAKSFQSCPTLCDPIDGSPPGSSISGILQARILEWVAISFFKAYKHAKSLQSCLTLCDPMDSSPPGSSVHRILQARILEWAAISFSTNNCIHQDKSQRIGASAPIREDMKHLRPYFKLQYGIQFLAILLNS